MSLLLRFLLVPATHLFSSAPRPFASAGSTGSTRTLLLGAVWSACFAAAASGQHLREGGISRLNPGGAPLSAPIAAAAAAAGAGAGAGAASKNHEHHREQQRLADVEARRQLAAVEVDGEVDGEKKGQSSATGGSLFAMQKTRT